jgi:hypothetical protein
MLSPFVSVAPFLCVNAVFSAASVVFIAVFPPVFPSIRRRIGRRPTNLPESLRRHMKNRGISVAQQLITVASRAQAGDAHQRGKYVCVVEGAIPTKENGIYY